MGRVQEDGRHFQAFFRRPLQPRFPYCRLPVYSPEPARNKFPVEPLPPEWAVYVEGGRFIPICTWGDCVVNFRAMTKDRRIDGNPLMNPGVDSAEVAQTILLQHLERAHHVKNIVTPFEPYGLVFEVVTRRPVRG